MERADTSGKDGGHGGSGADTGLLAVQEAALQQLAQTDPDFDIVSEGLET